LKARKEKETVFTLTIRLEKVTEVSDEKILLSFKGSEDKKPEDVSLLIDEEKKVESEEEAEPAGNPVLLLLKIPPM